MSSYIINAWSANLPGSGTTNDDFRIAFIKVSLTLKKGSSKDYIQIHIYFQIVLG